MGLRGVRLTTALCAVLLLAVATVWFGVRADGSERPRCERFAADAAARAALVSGSGRAVAVIGDSYSVGLGLDRPADSWPSRLDGRVSVAGFSGSGFSAGASGCRGVSFAERADAESVQEAELVVVEGGLNDYDQSDAAVRAGFERLMARLQGRQVVLVGPASAPARAGAVPRVDALLAELAAAHDVAYLSLVELELDYLDDRLHLTADGHEAFGRHVAERIAELGL